METVIIPFRVRRTRIPQAKAAIRRFLGHVRRSEPGTLAYESLQDRSDPTRFVHYMVFRNAKAHAHHRTTPQIAAFIDAIEPLCLKTPEPQFLQRWSGIVPRRQ